MPTMIDRIQDFINWLKENTDFDSWDKTIQDEVHRSLIVFMISDKKEKDDRQLSFDFSIPESETR